MPLTYWHENDYTHRWACVHAHKCCISRILNAIHLKLLRLIPSHYCSLSQATISATSTAIHSKGGKIKAFKIFSFAQPSSSISTHHLRRHAWTAFFCTMWPFPAEIKRHTDTQLQGKDREAMLQLSNWHCSSSASTQKEPHKTEKPCVPVDNVTLFSNAGSL